MLKHGDPIIVVKPDGKIKVGDTGTVIYCNYNMNWAAISVDRLDFKGFKFDYDHEYYERAWGLEPDKIELFIPNETIKEYTQRIS